MTMLRRALLILSVVGLVASAGLFIFNACGWGMLWMHSGYHRAIGTMAGTLTVGWRAQGPLGQFPAPFGQPPTGWQAGRIPAPVWFVWLPHTEVNAPVRIVMIPLWMPALLCAFMPGLCGLARFNRGRRRRRFGLCEACGYDLRGSPERCSECGTSTNETRTARRASCAFHLVDKALWRR